MAADKRYSVRYQLVEEGSDGKPINEIAFNNMKYEDVLALQAKVMDAVKELGKDKLAEKKRSS